jgi:hypothetical protein
MVSRAYSEDFQNAQSLLNVKKINISLNVPAGLPVSPHCITDNSMKGYTFQVLPLLPTLRRIN